MPKRISYSDAHGELRALIDELQQSGDYLVVEDADHRAVACLAPLPASAVNASRDEAARKLREILDSFPQSSPYSEEETFRHIEEALAATREHQVTK